MLLKKGEEILLARFEGEHWDGVIPMTEIHGMSGDFLTDVAPKFMVNIPYMEHLGLPRMSRKFRQKFKLHVKDKRISV